LQLQVGNAMLMELATGPSKQKVPLLNEGKATGPSKQKVPLLNEGKATGPLKADRGARLMERQPYPFSSKGCRFRTLNWMR
jgi:hypothetical protein